MQSSSTPIRVQNQEKLNYLQIIQGIVNRMAGNSALMKGFAATIFVGIYGMLLCDGIQKQHIIVALIPVIGFFCLDIYYLSLERKYRNLYKLVANDTVYTYYYTLDLKDKALDSQMINENAGIMKCIFSLSILLFYSFFVAAGLVFIIII